MLVKGTEAETTDTSSIAINAVVKLSKVLTVISYFFLAAMVTPDESNRSVRASKVQDR